MRFVVIIRGLLFVVGCVIHGARCLLFVCGCGCVLRCFVKYLCVACRFLICGYCSLLFGVWCLLFVVRCVLFVVVWLCVVRCCLLLFDV